jgi:RNA polymerase sigma factor (sigma-70 family)
VADDASRTEHADDATLLNKVRAGDNAAFGVLYQRHEPSARRLAGHLVPPAEVDDVVAETFARVLNVTKVGGGPTDAFRPYLLTALRRVSSDRLRAPRAQVPLRGGELPDPGELFIDPAVGSLDKSLIVRAFRSLPERWSAVLWHTEVEEATPAEAAPIFGLSRNGVAALRRKAGEGLRQAYLQMHAARVRPDCRPLAEQLGGYLRNSLSRRDALAVAEHLSSCDDCGAVYAELADVGVTLRGLVAPIYLGSAASAYLSGAAQSAAVGAAIAPAGIAGARIAAGKSASAGAQVAGGVASDPDASLLSQAGPPGLLGRFRQSPRQQRVLVTVAAVFVVAIAAGAWAATISGKHATPPARPAGAAAAATTPTQGSSPTSSPSPSGDGKPARKKHRQHPATSPAASSSPASAPGPSGPAFQLAASIDANGPWGPWNVAEVVFHVTDTGAAATGKLRATISLPAGASLLSSGQTHGFGPGQDGGSDDAGWSCATAGSGVTCQHAPIGPSASTQGVIFIGLTSAGCGQPAEVTVSSRARSVTASSPEEFQCS